MGWFGPSDRRQRRPHSPRVRAQELTLMTNEKLEPQARGSVRTDSRAFRPLAFADHYKVGEMW
jgi:hypothetical protein